METFESPKDSLDARIWRNVKVVRLAERQGFGFAVKARLPDAERASVGLHACVKGDWTIDYRL